MIVLIEKRNGEINQIYLIKFKILLLNRIITKF